MKEDEIKIHESSIWNDVQLNDNMDYNVNFDNVLFLRNPIYLYGVVSRYWESKEKDGLKCLFLKVIL